jgi:alkanesulfonate monooxygenase SsuD/methylene tetrahydromethanopterin reductase-like flavin-dependent oxidoreductase (luciferase family)
VPDELADLRALVGAPARIRERYRAWADCGANGALIQATQDDVIDLMAEIADLPRA